MWRPWVNPVTDELRSPVSSAARSTLCTLNGTCAQRAPIGQLPHHIHTFSCIRTLLSSRDLSALHDLCSFDRIVLDCSSNLTPRLQKS